MSKNRGKKDHTSKDRNDPLFELQGYHYRAIELRYQGRTYKEIMGDIGIEFRKGIHFDTIRKWFSRGGLLSAEYMDYARQENDQRRQLMREELKKLVAKIPQKVEKLLDREDDQGQPDMVVVQTIKLMADMLGISANEEAATGDRLGEYFGRLEKAPMPVKDRIETETQNEPAT